MPNSTVLKGSSASITNGITSLSGPGIPLIKKTESASDGNVIEIDADSSSEIIMASISTMTPS